MKRRASTGSSSFLSFHSSTRNMFHVSFGVQLALFLHILLSYQSKGSESPTTNDPGTIIGRSLKPAIRPETSRTLFDRLSHDQTQVDYMNIMDLNHPLRYLNYAGSACGGVAIGDINGDNKPDLFFTNAPHSNKLFTQVAPFVFKDITAVSKVSGGNNWGAGTAMADVDNDGDLDIYVCNYDAPNELFINQGPGKPFLESAESFGLDRVDASIMPSFADYDNDGDLDIFVLTYRYVRPGGRPNQPPVGFKNGKPYILPAFEKYYHLRKTGPNGYTADTCGRPDFLFRNNGNGTFTDVSAQAGILENGHGFSATWWDYNSDGFIDLYVGNDFTDPDHLYRNNGDGTFTDTIADVMPYTTWSSMGADCADLNNDGLLDFMSADMAATTHYKTHITLGEMGDRRWFLENAWPRQIGHNMLYLNTGTERFMEVGFLANLAATDWTWAIKLADFDNDGRVDVFTTNGSSRMSTDADTPIMPSMLIGHTEWDLWKDEPPLLEQNFAFKNHGNLNFQDTSKAWGLDHIGMSYGAAYGDLDGDGDLDLVTANLNEHVGIYRNNEIAGHRLTVRLKGTQSNRYGLGAIVRIKDKANGSQIRQLNPATGYLSSNEPILHFGLGEAESIDSLTVTWPGGKEQTFHNLKTDQHYIIQEKETQLNPATKNTELVSFTEVSAKVGLTFKHEETPFEDRQRQPLLPSKHSQLGGGMAWGDVDGDGDEDIYFAAAAGQPGALFLQKGKGQFTQDTVNKSLFNAHRRHEDMTPLWFDLDSDGDLDLFVSSGGVECNPGDPVLFDRLYLNDGKGKLTAAPKNVMPQKAISSGSAAASDFDGDGDIDLFIGGRVIPGRYPETPESRLLQNNHGIFSDVTDTLAPNLRHIRMVTSAIWSDVQNDGKPDLLITLEWGSVRCFINQGGRLEDTTEKSQLSKRRGWWNAITGADVDYDGDMDYVVMNVGLNTKYGTPSDTHPALLYYGAMDDSRRPKLIEAQMRETNLVPLRSLSYTAEFIPSLYKKFPTFKSYASSLLPEIYTEKHLNQALRLSANHFESGILINDGQGNFKWQSMPKLIQASPGFGVVTADMDGDGNLDIHAVQNFYSREPETGLWRGGIGFSGSFNQQGAFKMKPFSQSGFLVSGDGKGLTICDFNEDGWPDLLATQNNDHLLAFRNNHRSGEAPLSVTIRGPKGNPTGIGVRVTAILKEGHSQTAEIYAGSGYLSQSAPTLYFASPEKISRIHTQWPDGIQTDTSIGDHKNHKLIIHHPVHLRETR